MHREILEIFRRAGPQTRTIYELGRDTAGAAEENWVIRWMFWHVRRYRRRPSPSQKDLSDGIAQQSSDSLGQSGGGGDSR
jgi:hypothetical protein